MTLTLFLFIADLIDRVTECNDSSVLTRIHTLKSDNVNQLPYSKAVFGGYKTAKYKLSKMIRQLKPIWKVLSGDLEGTNHFTLKLHVPEHILEGVSRFGALNVLDVSFFEQFI